MENLSAADRIRRLSRGVAGGNSARASPRQRRDAGATFYEASAAGSSAARGCGLEAIRERVGNRVTDYVFVVSSQKFPQAIGFHQVLARHVGSRFRRDGHNPEFPQHLQDHFEGKFARNPHKSGICHFDATVESHGFAAASHVQYRQPLRFGFGLLEDVDDQSRHIIHVNKLDEVIQVPSAGGQQAGQTPATVAHPGSPIAAAVGCTTESADHVVVNAGTCKNMRTQGVSAATAQSRGALLDHSDPIPFCEWRRAECELPADAPRLPARVSLNRKPKRYWGK